MVERAPVNRAPGYAWELYDLTHDFNQTRDLARRYPDKLAEMQRLFAQEATHYNVDPINDRTDPARSNSWMQAYGRPRTHYDYWGAGLTIPLDSAPPIEGRGFTVMADLSAGDGVIAATGSQLGGWSFAIEKGHPAIHHALTLMPSDQFTLLSPVALAAGQHARVTFDFDYDGGGFGKGGLLSIAIDGRRAWRQVLLRDRGRGGGDPLLRFVQSIHVEPSCYGVRISSVVTSTAGRSVHVSGSRSSSSGNSARIAASSAVETKTLTAIRPRRGGCVSATTSR